MIEILPAVLPHDFAELKAGLARIAGASRLVQVDIVDGHYARGKTWPYKDGAQFGTAVAQEGGLPHWEELDFEFDLMVEDPGAVALDYARAGAARAVVHAGSKTAAAALAVLAGLNDNEEGPPKIAVGIALGAHEHPDVLLSFTDLFDYIQVMGIAHEGRQGEALDPQVFVLIERLRHRYASMPIQVDGGVRIENARQLVAAGATRLVCGSAIFGQEDAKAAYEALYNEVNSGAAS